jgi:AcrR family transcriptional regulator
MVQSPPTPHAVSAARTREALTDAAFTLFSRDGFDATTTDRIAQRAGVSPRTFFRYFPTKESVVFHRDYGFMRSFASAYFDSPASASDYEAVRATFVELAAGFEGFRSRIETTAPRLTRRRCSSAASRSTWPITPRRWPKRWRAGAAEPNPTLSARPWG